jgi:endonuclease-3
MARESANAKVERTQQIIAGLSKAYPKAHCELDFRNPLELLIATILSAQCTDKRVNLVTRSLFQKYRAAADYAKADPTIFEKEIQSTGFFRNKTRSILAAANPLWRNMVEKCRATSTHWCNWAV